VEPNGPKFDLTKHVFGILGLIGALYVVAKVAEPWAQESIKQRERSEQDAEEWKRSSWLMVTALVIGAIASFTLMALTDDANAMMSTSPAIKAAGILPMFIGAASGVYLHYVRMGSLPWHRLARIHVIFMTLMLSMMGIVGIINFIFPTMEQHQKHTWISTGTVQVETILVTILMLALIAHFVQKYAHRYPAALRQSNNLVLVQDHTWVPEDVPQEWINWSFFVVRSRNGGLPEEQIIVKGTGSDEDKMKKLRKFHADRMNQEI